MNDYRIAWCPVCRAGWVIVVRDTKTKMLFLYCKECESEWDEPLAIIEHAIPTREKYGLAEVANLEEIRQRGWHKFILED